MVPTKHMKKITVKMKREGLEMKANREDVAMAVKTFRLRQGWTQKQLGEHWNMSRYTIIRLESGKPISWEYAYKVFAKLSVDLEKEEL